MASALANIVMVQYLPGTEEYIVYREGAEAELYRGGSTAKDSDFYVYAQECMASGCVCESTFHVPTGRVEGARFIICKQIMYSKALAEGSSARAVMSGAKGIAAGAVNAVANALNGSQTVKRDAQFVQSNIQWVKWHPAMFELSICSGKIPIPKVHRIHDLNEASEEVLDYMAYCFKRKFFSLKRSYQMPVQDGRKSHMTLVTEYYFSVSKPHKDFQGSSAQVITAEDMSDLGLIAQ